MPNTLGHLGVQGVVTRALIRNADLKWICAGAVVPDVPWILQRAASSFVSGGSAIDLRLYAIVQASLALTLLLAAGLALFSADPARVFRILSVGAIVHLLLDATQNHWGNGVHLYAPFSWHSIRFGLYWPESAVALTITIAGVLFVAYAWRRSPGVAIALRWPSRRTGTAAAIVLAGYVLLPLALVGGPLRADSQSLGALSAGTDRVGRSIELERVPYERGIEGDTILVVTGEQLAVTGLRARRPGLVSIRGRFVSDNAIEVLEIHEHWRRFRDLGTYAGLILVASVWWADARRRASA